VDIDLNYIGALLREAMEAGRSAMEAALAAILAAQGYQVRRQPAEHAGGKWVARFGSALGAAPASRSISISWPANLCSGCTPRTQGPFGASVGADRAHADAGLEGAKRVIAWRAKVSHARP